MATHTAALQIDSLLLADEGDALVLAAQGLRWSCGLVTGICSQGVQMPTPVADSLLHGISLALQAHALLAVSSAAQQLQEAGHMLINMLAATATVATAAAARSADAAALSELAENAEQALSGCISAADDDELLRWAIHLLATFRLLEARCSSKRASDCTYSHLQSRMGPSTQLLMCALHPGRGCGAQVDGPAGAGSAGKRCGILWKRCQLAGEFSGHAT